MENCAKFIEKLCKAHGKQKKLTKKGLPKNVNKKVEQRRVS